MRARLWHVNLCAEGMRNAILGNDLKVTTCLYLSPNNRARSLSTLVALVVSKATEAGDWRQNVAHNNAGNPCVVTKVPMWMSQRHPTDNTERLCNKTNAEISRGQTSKQEFGRRMKGRHISKATRIRILPGTAVMDTRMLNAERYMNSFCIPLAQEVEHQS